METDEELFAKRYSNKDQMCDNLSKTNSVIVNLCQRQKKDYYHLIQPYTKPPLCQKQCDEPIDLTQSQNRSIKREEIIETIPPKIVVKSKGRRPKIYNNPPNPNYMQNFFKDVIELQTTETKQGEILKAAKSLFSKRTRTLYHWMYPNTPKQQIKMAVANSWDNLGTQEKQFYISQVLVRFGFPECSLMVNPQLGGIKELPPLPDTIETNSYAEKELQTAISSISNSGEPSSSHHEVKKRQGRPPGSKNKKHKNELVTYKITKDFQDDPELSKELEKFAISFDCFK